MVWSRLLAHLLWRRIGLGMVVWRQGGAPDCPCALSLRPWLRLLRVASRSDHNALPPNPPAGEMGTLVAVRCKVGKRHARCQRHGSALRHSAMQDRHHGLQQEEPCQKKDGGKRGAWAA